MVKPCDFSAEFTGGSSAVRHVDPESFFIAGSEVPRDGVYKHVEGTDKETLRKGQTFPAKHNGTVASYALLSHLIPHFDDQPQTAAC